MTAVTYSEDSFGDVVIRDAIPRYAQMLGPVLWLAQNNAYAVTRDAQAREVLRRPDVFQSGKGLSLNDDVNALLTGSTLNSDDPAHVDRRSVTACLLMPIRAFETSSVKVVAA